MLGAGKVQLSKRVTHFSCEMKVNSNPVFLGAFSASQRLWTLELLQKSKRGREHEVDFLIKSPWVQAKIKHFTFPSLSPWGWPRVCEVRIHSLFLCAELQLDWIGKSGYRSASEGEKILTMASWI